MTLSNQIARILHKKLIMIILIILTLIIIPPAIALLITFNPYWVLNRPGSTKQMFASVVKRYRGIKN